MNVIKVIKDDKGYTFDLPSMFKSYNQVMKVDGEVVETGKLYTIDHLPKIECFQSVSVKQYAKPLVEGLPDLSIDEYENKLHELKNGSHYDEYKECTVFETLGKEYEYKKFLASYKVIYKEDLVKVKDYELQVEEKIPSDNSYIIPFRHLGNSFTNQKALYKRRDFMLAHIRKCLNDKEFVEEEKSLSGSKKGEYKVYHYNDGMIKLFIEGKSIYDNTDLRDRQDDYEALKQQYESDKRMIEEMIDKYVINTSKIPNMQEVIHDLKFIYNKAKSIDYKTKSYDQYNSTINAIKSTVAKYGGTLS